MLARLSGSEGLAGKGDLMSEPSRRVSREKEDSFCFCLCIPSSVSWQALMGTSSPGALLGMEGERS